MNRPLDSFPIARTRDTDEAQSVLSRELCDLRFDSVRDRSRFAFVMNGVRLGQTSVAFNQFATEAVVDAGTIERTAIVSYSVGPPAVPDLDGELVGTNRLAIVAPPRRLKVRRAAGSGVVVLRTGSTAIEQRFRELTGKDLTEPILFDRSTIFDQGVGAQIRRLLAYLVDDAGHADTILSNPLVRNALDDMLLSAIVSLPSNHSKLIHCERPVQAAMPLVRRAEEFMEAHAAEPITISDVVSECGCSRRTLFHAFRRHRGYTPLQFLAEVRLKSARDALLVATPTTTVTSIALACGFTHLGRFTAAYCKRFGERPSESLRRAITFAQSIWLVFLACT